MSKYLASGGKIESFLALFSKSTLLGPRFAGLCLGMELSDEGSSG